MARHGVAETLTGGVVLLIAGGFLAYAVAHSGRATGEGYPLTAQFDKIDGLAVGADVRIGGVKVGSVTGEYIDPKSYQAIVSLTVQDNIKLPKDTAAIITSESLLGGKYITLAPGGEATDLKPGAMITITQSSVSLEELLGKFIFSVTQLNSSKKEGDSTAPSGGSSQSGAPK
jgi:phospholipid/cholesterol/gamma-HCH transport system substrate-binding protein